MLTEQTVALNAYRPTIAEINLAAIKKNVKAIRKMAKSPLLMAVVKTNAYGHGLIQCAKAVLQAGAQRLGVSIVEEGALLREAGITAPIHILSAVDPDQAMDIVKNDLIASVSCRIMVAELSKAALQQKKNVKLHLKIDSGLHRFGVLPEYAEDFCKAVYALPSLVWEGVFTHFSSADEGNWEFTDLQTKTFLDVLKKLNQQGYSFPIRHVGGSTIALERPDLHFDMVRPGIALYGYYPDPRQKSLVELEQAMTLRTRIIQIREVGGGVAVGYGGAYRPETKTRIATLPIGYGDGYNRAISKKAQVLINGKRCGLAGKISLDQTLVDLAPVPDAEVGDEVVLLGKQGEEMIFAQEMAEWMDSITDQVVSTLTVRMPRAYADD